MAPAVCVTSFRLLMRRPDLAGQLSRGLRLTPAGTLTANSWSTKARRFCTKSDDTTCPDDEQPITGKTKSINEKASPQNDGSTKARSAQTAQTAVAASAAAAAVAAATATATAAAVRLQSGKSMQTHSQTPKTPHLNEPLVSDEDFVPDADYGRMRVSQLRAKLRAHGLSTVGKKDALINRLENYLQLKMNAPGYRTLPYDLQEDNADAAHATQTTTTATEATATAPLVDIVGKMPEERGERATSTPSSETSAASPVEESATAARATDDQPQASAILNLSSAAAPIKVDLPSEYVDGLAASDRSSSRTAARKASSHSSSGGGSGNANDGNGDGDGGGKRNSANNPPTRSTTSAATANDPPQRQGDAFVEYIHGLPHLTVPLPSRRENCRFALKPVSHKVGDLVEMLKTEDRGIDRATVLNNCGVRIASTCNIDSLMDEPFVLQINDTKYEVVPPKRQKIDVEDINKLGDVRSLVAQLYEALHVGEYHLHKEQELVSKLENLQHQLSPLEMQKEELSKQADRKTIIMTWVGLGLMSVQFGILARLTWWEYSWDIMEPVTYFVTYGTTMAMYAYYCVTKTEYTFDEVRRRQFLFTIHKRAQKKKFDVETYNSLKRQIAEIEYDLRRLRDPINLQLPPHIDRAQRGPPASPPSSVPLTIVKKTSTLKKPGGFRLPFLEPKK